MVYRRKTNIYTAPVGQPLFFPSVCVFVCYCSFKTGYENNENYQLGLTSFSGRLIFPPEILHIPYKICTGGRVFFVFFLVKTTNYYLCRNSSLLQLPPNFTFNLQNLILVVHPFRSIELVHFIPSLRPVSEYNTLLPFCLFPPLNTSQHAGEIWKRCFHSENASNHDECFTFTLRRRNLKS